MVLSAGTEKKAAFLIKKKVSNFSGYKTDKIKKKEWPCVLEVPQASPEHSQASFISHASCRKREAALAGRFPIPALPFSSTRTQWGRRHPHGDDSSKCSKNSRVWAPATPGGGAAWGAEQRLPGGKPEPGSTRDVGSWIRPFQPDENSVRARMAAGEERARSFTRTHPWCTHGPSSCSTGPSAACRAVPCILLK